MLASSLSDLLALPLPSEAAAARQRCYLTYHLSALRPCSPRVPSITLLESRSLISGSGTTGFRTWEAALHLGRYLCENPALVKGKRLLELGAGTGYLSILCAKHLGAAHCLASDGSEDVINYLPENIDLNCLQDPDIVSPVSLEWGRALVCAEEPEWNGGRPIDVVLGADIVYDRSLMPPLVATLQAIQSLNPGVKILISATERNRETFDAFKEASIKSGFAIRQIQYQIPPKKQQAGPFYSDEVPIHICEVRKRGVNGGLQR